MKKKSIFGLVGIIVFGVAVGFGVLTTLNNGTEKVVVPVTTIKAGQQFSSENLKEVDMPKRAIVPGVTITSIKDIVGKTAVSNILTGEMVTESKIANTKGEGYIANMVNPKQNYAIQIPVSDTTPVKGISVGDNVSLLATAKGEGQNTATGKIGEKYRVIGINENESGLVVGLTIEVEPATITEVSHALINCDFAISFVSPEHEVVQVPGVTQQTILDKLSK